MRSTPLLATVLGLTLALGLGAPSFAQSTAKHAAHAGARHKVVFQVSDNDPKKWQLALNNVANIQKDLGAANVDIELVAYGPGIGILKMDSKVADRIHDALAAHVKISACQNTMRGQQLTKEDMLPDIGYVPSGVVELMTKQEQGYAYIRP